MSKFNSRFTPYDDSYPTCEYTYAELRIYPGELSPDFVTKWLDIIPTAFQNRGDIRITSSNREHKVKSNGWFLSSENQQSSKDIRRHLDWLLDKLEVASSQLKNLQQQPGVTMVINCIWWSAHGQGGPTIWPEQMKKMAEMNLEYSFDISFFGFYEENKE